MSINRALSTESSYEISLRNAAGALVILVRFEFFQSLHYTCFSSAIRQLQVPDPTCNKLSTYLYSFLDQFSLLLSVLDDSSNKNVKSVWVPISMELLGSAVEMASVCVHESTFPSSGNRNRC